MIPIVDFLHIHRAIQIALACNHKLEFMVILAKINKSMFREYHDELYDSGETGLNSMTVFNFKIPLNSHIELSNTSLI